MGHIGHWHGLQPNPARAGQQCVKKAFSSQKLIFDAGYLTDIHGNSGFIASNIAGIHHDLLTGRQLILHQFAIDLYKSHPLDGKALHNKAFAA